MILEAVMLPVKAGMRVEFEAAFRLASPFIASAPGYAGHELQHCLERPGNYLLLVRWQTRAEARPAVVSMASEALSPRESEVLNLLARGFTYTEAAQRMGVFHSTVQTHVRNIYGKLGVHNKTEAVFEARQLGLLR